MEKVLIKNFAGLKEVSLEVSPVTGLIGPQASGKSVIAKLLYFFREVSSRLPAAVLIDGMGVAEYKGECSKRFTRYFPCDNTGSKDFEVTYFSGSEHVRVIFATEQSTNQQLLTLEWSEFFPLAIDKLTQRKQELLSSSTEPEKEAVSAAQRVLRNDYDEEASEVLGHWAICDQIFIPAGRSFFSQFRASVFTRLESGETLDPFMVAFGSLLEQSKSLLETRGFFGSRETLAAKDARRIEELHATFKAIMHAEMCRSDKQDFLRFDDGRRVKLAQASSGQQEALPLLLLLARFVSLSHVRGRAVYIEEPEAHLFPSTQKQIVEVMAQAFRQRQDQMCLVITTHSPYIVTSINNLLQAGNLYARATPDTAKQLNRIIPRSRVFNPGEVGFYALKDGLANSIMDNETGLIDATVIDQVSNDISIQFDELLAGAK